ncbi:MAG TPA: tetratricopeptide repeat protein, partial [Anaerolineae bacterium]|nr:tetratricopeptide repeat protein [Anaerolineae bacterium]
LQHQAILQDDLGRQERAVALYQQAMALFQRASDVGSEMRTCDLLASAERARGQLEAAEAWYARSRELALQLHDRHQLAVVAQNVGILYQTRAKRAQDPAARAAFLRQAIGAVQESLRIKLELQNQVGAALSYFQLGVLYRMAGDLERAEEQARQALQIRESLNLPDVYRDYANLAEIAHARGDGEAAARWQAKCDAKVAELERLRRGGGDGETGRQGDKETRGRGDKETRRRGDKGTRRQGDKETRRQGDKETGSWHERYWGWRRRRMGRGGRGGGCRWRWGRRWRSWSRRRRRSVVSRRSCGRWVPASRCRRCRRGCRGNWRPSCRSWSRPLPGRMPVVRVRMRGSPASRWKTCWRSS